MKTMFLIAIVASTTLFCSCDSAKTTTPTVNRSYGSREVVAISFIREKDTDMLEIYPTYGAPNLQSTQRYIVRIKDGSVWFYEVTFSGFGSVIEGSLTKSMIFPPIGQ